MNKQFTVGFGDFTGTSFKGYIKTTYDKLVEKFGPPSHGRSGDGKVNCEWVLRFNDGLVCTIYDWKEPVIPIGEYNWHVGGKFAECVDRVESVLKS